MHVHDLAVALVAADSRRHDDERVPGDKVAYAARVAVGRVKVELEGLARRSEQDQAVQALPQCLGKHCEVERKEKERKGVGQRDCRVDAKKERSRVESPERELR